VSEKGSYINSQIRTFSVAGGTHNSDQSVALSTATSGATIYYTDNGDTPTTSSSTQYSRMMVLPMMLRIIQHGVATP
jgi:hypothetical protein